MFSIIIIINNNNQHHDSKNILNRKSFMNKMFIIVTILLLINNDLSMTESLELRANCGFPGKPYRSKIIPEEKSVYDEGETVRFQCSDYESPPQMRKCVNGVWVGPPARCGDFVNNVELNDAKLLDMSFGLPIEKFHYRNITLTSMDKNFPNSFLSHRYPNHRLRITNDHEFMWKLNFTRPAVKLFVRVNFNFINFTLLDQAIRNNFSFYIDVEISPYRTCNLDYQNNNAWRDNGNRIDSYFTCEAHSYQDLQRDLENPNNYMIMRTKSSHNLPHELVAIFFGTVYGNESEPICGEPETDFGQTYRVRQEHHDYIIDCLDSHWKDVTPNTYKHFINHQKCIGDMIWNGTKPRCIPIRNCPIQKILNNNRRNFNENDSEKNPLVVDAILGYYNFIDNQTIYAIDGTEIVYGCASNDYIVVGKDKRTCKRDMTWSGVEPVCKYIKQTNEVVESSNYLVIIIIFMGTLLFLIIFASIILFLFYTKHLKITKKDDQNNGNSNESSTQNEWQGENYYDNIEMNFNHQTGLIGIGLGGIGPGNTGVGVGVGGGKSNDIFYDIYETVDSNKENDYIRMYGSGFKVNETGILTSSNNNINNNNNNNNTTTSINNNNNNGSNTTITSSTLTSSTILPNTGMINNNSGNNGNTSSSSSPMQHHSTSNIRSSSSIQSKQMKNREPSYLEVMQ
ncbi:uncharacterized protein LOC113789893 isoform X2 [Dermatophagoides pteronyssinus]|uniref:Probable serine/threonine-protein kinase DDB_G0283337 isoform X2 n=1 Tax=Dermatophagoides pteronyssinus TaxID=6956 RepID=A0A6P6XR04_DERPT|nr:probable serine/threonine-protein kinase DDB_G0283337 isoform X2 [Dermatophagoides pteronyssinus]